MKVYSGNTITLRSIQNKRIAVLGYGSQGRAQALNLADSGCDVVVGLRSKSPSFLKAKRDGVIALPIEKALERADFICFLFPDECQAETYDKYVAPILKKGSQSKGFQPNCSQPKYPALVFAHGFNITYKKIIPPPNIDVFLAAPKGPGPMLRESYLKAEGLSFLMAVHQNASSKAKTHALSFAKAAGALQQKIFETTFRDETISDLFGEQAVLCGGVIELMKAAFETLVKEGIAAEAAYFECFHELKFIVDILHHKGIEGMGKVISHTAHYGGMTRGQKLIDQHVRKKLRDILLEITSGKFAKEWLKENKKGLPYYRKMVRQTAFGLLEKTGKNVRKTIGYDRFSRSS